MSAHRLARRLGPFCVAACLFPIAAPGDGLAAYVGWNAGGASFDYYDFSNNPSHVQLEYRNPDAAGYPAKLRITADHNVAPRKKCTQGSTKKIVNCKIPWGALWIPATHQNLVFMDLGWEADEVTIMGSPGPGYYTYVIGSGGGDTLTGGPGDEEFHMTDCTSPDVVDGGGNGPYGDTVRYVTDPVNEELPDLCQTDPYKVDLGSPLHNGQGCQSSATCENDQLYNIENVDVARHGEVTWDSDDVLIGNAKANKLTDLNGGTDRIYGCGGSDQIDGGEGPDVAVGDFSLPPLCSDQALGTSNDDRLVTEVDDVISGGPGLDIADYSALAQSLTIAFGGTSGLTARGFEGVVGGRHSDIIVGDERNNLILGGFGNDLILDQGGSDVIDGQVGNDFVYAGPGNDWVVDTGDNTRYGLDDTLMGGPGSDIVSGGLGDDTLFGEGSIFGSSPAVGDPDWLFGGDGYDTLNARDGDSDHLLDCGEGTAPTGGHTGGERLNADLLPLDPASVISGCETVNRG